MKEKILDVDVDVEQCKKIFSLLSLCTDEYMFFYDMHKDYSVISDGAVERFQLENVRCSNVIYHLKTVVHPDDYPIVKEELLQIQQGKKVIHNMEYRWIGADTQPVWVSCRGMVIPDKEGRPNLLIGRVAEIDKKGKIDSVTGLYRECSLRKKLAAYQKEEHIEGFLLQIGIDNFKNINEKYGLSVGNKILARVAECLKEITRGLGSIYRMNGDEMMILCTGYDNTEEDPAKALYKRIRCMIDESISKNDFQLFHTISGGIVYFDETSAAQNNLLEKAAFSLHQAKIQGKNTCVKYTKDAYDTYVQRMDMQEYLRKDIKNDFRGFELYYQPIIYVKEKKILGAEALLRWNSKQLGFMSPGDFIPLLEESGLIIPLGRWIIKTALSQCKIWQKIVPEFRISINLSFVQLKKSDAVKDIMKLMDELNADSEDVLFEVTESGELESENAIQVLKSFKTQLISLAIDDFGTGYSNLRYVKDMTFDLVKIDQSFIGNIRNSQYDYLLVKQFTELVHTLNLKVSYEGVETKEDLDCVLELKPDYIQGFYFSRPIPAQEFQDRFLSMNNVLKMEG